jgi:hypothetical protein
MDPENQSNIKNMVDQYGAGNLVIVPELRIWRVLRSQLKL